MPTPNHAILASSATSTPPPEQLVLPLENATTCEQQCIQSSCSAGGKQSPISAETSTHPVPDMLPTPEAIALLEEYFCDAIEKKKLHSFYTCCGKCADVSEAEKARIQSQKKTTDGKKKGVDMFKHSWITDRKTSFCNNR